MHTALKQDNCYNDRLLADLSIGSELLMETVILRLGKRSVSITILYKLRKKNQLMLPTENIIFWNFRIYIIILTELEDFEYPLVSSLLGAVQTIESPQYEMHCDVTCSSKHPCKFFFYRPGSCRRIEYIVRSLSYS
jgi:hypothetical protein